MRWRTLIKVDTSKVFTETRKGKKIESYKSWSLNLSDVLEEGEHATWVQDYFPKEYSKHLYQEITEEEAALIAMED